MKKKGNIHLDFEVDKLTNSIENAVSGEVFETIIMKLKAGELKHIKKGEWSFNWHNEVKEKTKQVYKLCTANNQGIIQGLISITDKGDHIFMDLIENAIFNKGKNKLYKGVAGNLVAFACKLSFELNYDGIVSFISKTQLIIYYQQSLGAKLFGGNRMYMDTKEALTLVKKYFKDFNYGRF